MERYGGRLPGTGAIWTSTEAPDNEIQKTASVYNVKVKYPVFARWLSAAGLKSAVRDGAIMDAPNFNRMLCLERKRSHRTGIPFVLLIVDVSGLPGSSRKISSVCDALQSQTRDTDLCGWHQPSKAIGIIFTALQDLDRSSIEAAIAAKMNRALRTVLDSGEFGRITLSFHFFPENSESGDASPLRADEKLYPDLIDTAVSKSFYLGLKRVIDVLGSLAFIVLIAPLLALIAASIKLTSTGPVLFQQTRIGRFGKEFKCLKFRTMYTDCDHEIHRQYVEELIRNGDAGQKVYKIVRDPRVTPVGRILRKLSLDELPQFFNVLSGDMSLVGPRPPIPYEIALYRSWHRRRVIETKPGITGLWQVYGRSRTTFDDMVRLDIRYIEKQSLWLDLKLLVRTPWVVITCAGAY